MNIPKDCYFVNYDNVFVPFHDCVGMGGIDMAIKIGSPVVPERAIYKELFKPGQIVYDIGAYSLTHSIQYILWGGIVYAFEPAQFNYQRCLKNALPFRHLKVFDVAFHEKEYDVISAFKDCNNLRCDNNDIVQPIKYRILEKFMKENNLPNPDFIKIDVEGMETLLLKTMDFLFRGCRPIIYIEMHQKDEKSVNLQNYKDNPNWQTPNEGGFDFNELKKQNLDIWNFHGDHRAIKLSDDMDFNKIQAGLVLVPKEKAIDFNAYNIKHFGK